MKSDPWSVGTIFRSWTMLLAWSLGGGLWGCAGVQTKDRLTPVELEERKKSDAEVQTHGEVTLAQDRSELSELRKDIPPEVQKKNDELALIFDLMRDGQAAPGEVRDRFDRHLRKKREDFRRGQSRAREAFNRDEKRRREEFVDRQKREKEDRRTPGREAEETRRFFKLQAEQRQEFFGDLQLARREFEAEQRRAVADFEATLRDQQKQFGDVHRPYARDFAERKRLEERARLKPRAPFRSPDPRDAGDQDMSEFEQMEKMKGTPLGP